MKSIDLIKIEPNDPTGNEEYRTVLGQIIKRESNSKSPDGNPLNNRWVLRAANGDYIDHDKYRHDLSERNGISFFAYTLAQYLKKMFE